MSHFFKPLQVLFIYIIVSGFVLLWNFFVCKVHACVSVSKCAYCAFSLTSFCLFLYYFYYFFLSFLLDVCTQMRERKGIGHDRWKGAGSLGRGNLNILYLKNWLAVRKKVPLLRCFVKGNRIRWSWCWALVFLLTLSRVLCFTPLCCNLLIWICTKARKLANSIRRVF